MQTLRYCGDARSGHVVLLDQTRLPDEQVEIQCRDVRSLVEAIRSLRVRGAPAIGIAAAYGVCLGLQNAVDADADAFARRLDEVTAQLAASRPTAVNLFWALDRMRRQAESLLSQALPPDQILDRLLDVAAAIHEEDRQACRQIGQHGHVLLADGDGVLTHCNAGALATADYGTALGVIYAAAEQGKRLHVYVDETRPLLQGARLTAWELMHRGIDTTLICDSAAAQLMKEHRVQAVLTGADRIAASGDAANKIGTYGLAVLAAAHDIPFYIAAPANTFDRSIAAGDDIPIEQRDPREVTHGFGRQTAPEGVRVYNPAFDVTPSRLVTAIITERGVIRPVSTETIARVLSTLLVACPGKQSGSLEP